MSMPGATGVPTQARSVRAVTQVGYGEIETLAVALVGVPTPGAGQVLWRSPPRASTAVSGTWSRADGLDQHRAERVVRCCAS